MKRRRLLIANAQSGGGDVRTELECYEAGTQICFINTRTYTKTNTGFAIAGVVHYDSGYAVNAWYGPIIVSREETNCYFNYKSDHTIDYGFKTFEYEGETWYVSGHGYFDYFDENSEAYFPIINNIANGGEPYPSVDKGEPQETESMAQAATDLLDYYFKVI